MFHGKPENNHPTPPAQHPGRRNLRQLPHVLEVVHLASPASGKDEEKTAAQTFEDTHKTVFLERYKKYLTEDNLKAALLAAETLSKQSVVLPPLTVDRSKWSKDVASALPLRKPSGADADEEREESSVDILTKGKRRKRRDDDPGANASRLLMLLGAVLERFLSGCQAREAAIREREEAARREREARQREAEEAEAAAAAAEAAAASAAAAAAARAKAPQIRLNPIKRLDSSQRIGSVPGTPSGSVGRPSGTAALSPGGPGNSAASVLAGFSPGAGQQPGGGAAADAAGDDADGTARRRITLSGAVRTVAAAVNIAATNRARTTDAMAAAIAVVSAADAEAGGAGSAGTALAERLRGAKVRPAAAGVHFSAGNDDDRGDGDGDDDFAFSRVTRGAGSGSGGYTPSIRAGPASWESSQPPQGRLTVAPPGGAGPVSAPLPGAATTPTSPRSSMGFPPPRGSLMGMEGALIRRRSYGGSVHLGHLLSFDVQEDAGTADPWGPRISPSAAAAAAAVASTSGAASDASGISKASTLSRNLTRVKSAIKRVASAKGQLKTLGMAANFATHVQNAAEAKSNPHAVNYHSLVMPKEREPTKCGVSLFFLQTLAGLVLGDIGKEAAEKLTTRQMVKRYITPRTAGLHCRFCDILPDSVVAVPRYAVSHRWEAPFSRLLNSLSRFFNQEDPERVFLWIDFFAMDVHAERDAAAAIVHMQDVIRMTQQTLLVLDPQGFILTRAWTLFEIWATVESQTTVGKLLILADGINWNPLLQEIYSSIDVSKAETAHDAEREVIMDRLKKACLNNLQDLSAINRQLHQSLTDAAQQEAHHAEKMLKTKHSHPQQYVSLTTQYGVMLHLDGRPDAGELYIRRALVYLLEMECGEGPDLIFAVRALVDVLMAQSKFPEALALCRKVQEQMERAFGGDHRDTLLMAVKFVEVLLQSRQLAAAEALARATLQRFERLERLNAAASGAAVAPDEPVQLQQQPAAQVMLLMGQALQQQGRLAEAQTVLSDAVSLHVALLGKAHPACADAFLAFGQNCQMRGDHREASSWFTQARTALLKVFSRESPLWVRTTLALARTLQALGDIRTAEKMVRRLLQAPTSRGKAAVRHAQIVAAGFVPPGMEEVEEEEARLMDVRMGGLSFEVCIHMCEVLCDKAGVAAQAAMDRDAMHEDVPDEPWDLPRASTASYVSGATTRLPSAATTMLGLFDDRASCDTAISAYNPDPQRCSSAAAAAFASAAGAGSISGAADAAAIAQAMHRTPSRKRRGMHVNASGVLLPAARQPSMRHGEAQQQQDPAADQQPSAAASRATSASSGRGVAWANDLAPGAADAAAVVTITDGGSSVQTATDGGGSTGGSASTMHSPRPPMIHIPSGSQRMLQPSPSGVFFEGKAPADDSQRPPFGFLGPPTETEKIMAEIVDLALKMLRRLQRALRAARAKAGGRADQGEDGASPRGRSRRGYRREGGTSTNRSPKARQSSFGAKSREGSPEATSPRRPRARRSSAGAADNSLTPVKDPAAAARRRMSYAGYASNSHKERSDSNNPAHAAEPEDPKAAAAGGAQRNAWREQLLTLSATITGRAEQMRMCGELGAAVMALRAAIAVSESLLGPSHTTCVWAVATCIDVLVCERRFVEARSLYLEYMHNKQGLSSGAKDALRARVTESMTMHAFAGAEDGDEEVCTWALELGATTIRGDERLLVLAASLGHTDVCRAIASLNTPSVLDEEGMHGMRALAMAASLGFAPIVELLIEKRAVVDAKDFAGRTALMMAARNGHFACLKMLMERGRANVNTRDNAKRTPLMLASQGGHLPIMQMLIEAGAHVDSIDSTQSSSLMYACRFGRGEGTEMLLRYKARANLKDKDGATALIYAAAGGHADCVYALLSNKCDVDYIDYLGQTAAMKAAKEGHIGILEMLLREGADTEIRDADGRSPLHLAAMHGHAQVAVLLISYMARGSEVFSGGRISAGAAASSGSATTTDLNHVGVPVHVRLKVDEVLAAMGVEVAAVALERQAQATAEAAEEMRRLLAPSTADPKLSRPSVANAEDLPGEIAISPRDGGEGEESSALVAAHRQTTAAAVLGMNSGVMAMAASRAMPTDSEMRTLLAYASLGQVRSYVSLNDKFGQTAAELAESSGYHGLAHLLQHFMKRPGHHQDDNSSSNNPLAALALGGLAAASSNPFTAGSSGLPSRSGDPTPVPGSGGGGAIGSPRMPRVSVMLVDDGDEEGWES